MRPAKPEVDAKTAEAWARDLYGISARASGLPGEIDRNYLMETGERERFVLKIAPAGSDRPSIEFQLAALEFLQQHETLGLTPRVIPAGAGSNLVEQITESGQMVLVRMVEYMPGEILAQAGSIDPSFWPELGAALGTLDRALESFDHPGARRELPWDLARLVELAPLLDGMHSELRPHVAAGLERYRERVLPRLGELPRSIIHNDANDYNILIRRFPDGGLQLAGLIDFGDMLHTITVAEPAIACAYAMMDRPDPEAVAESVIAGYEEARPLRELEEQLLPDLIIGRLCNSLLLSSQARRDSPDDAYLTISERPAAELLQRLL